MKEIQQKNETQLVSHILKGQSSFVRAEVFLFLREGIYLNLSAKIQKYKIKILLSGICIDVFLF